MAIDDEHDLIQVLSHNLLPIALILVRMVFLEDILYYMVRFNRVICVVLWSSLCALSTVSSASIDSFIYVSYLSFVVAAWFFIFSVVKGVFYAPMFWLQWLQNSNGACSDFFDIDAKYLSETIYVCYLVRYGIQTDSRIERDVLRIKIVRDLEPSNFDDYLQYTILKFGLDNKLRPEDIDGLLGTIREQSQLDNVINSTDHVEELPVLQF